MAESQPSATLALVADAPVAKSSQQSIDPWNVSGEVKDGVVQAINYDNLIENFGTKRISAEDIARFEQVTGKKAHRFIRRGIVFSHRDLNLILDRYERGEPFFLYTGRGPSSDSMHIGHTVPFEFTKWLQDVFDVPLIIMLTDDEKYIFGADTREIEDVQRFTEKNAKDIIAVGFDPKKTFMFSDIQYMGNQGSDESPWYKNIIRMQKKISFNTARAVFGFDDDSNIGKISFAATQGSTSFASSFPHIFGTDEKSTNAIPALIPCAIDQDPYFRLTRDVAARLHFAKPCLIHSRFLDALQGPGSKMSASVDESAIFMTDDAKKIKTKINKYAFSGGQVTEEEQRKLGGNPDVDVSFQYLTFFLEDDDELERIRKAYKSGEMLTGELKAIVTGELQTYVSGFQKRRRDVSTEDVEDFMSRKKLEWTGNPNPKIPEAKEEIVKEDEGSKGPSQNQLKKAAKAKLLAEQKAAKEAAKLALRPKETEEEVAARKEAKVHKMKTDLADLERRVADLKERIKEEEQSA